MSSTLFFIHSSRDYRDLHSFPTRRSSDLSAGRPALQGGRRHRPGADADVVQGPLVCAVEPRRQGARRSHSWRLRSEEHTSELQSLAYLVCRLLLEKKKVLDW